MSKHDRKGGRKPMGVKGYSRKFVAAAARLMESLEDRRLLSVTLGGDGALNIDGTAGNDMIVVGVDGDQIVATVDGQANSFARASVQSLWVKGMDGNDWISLGAGLPGVNVSGGAGDDTIVSGAGDDTLSGDSGNDSYVFYDGWGHDTVVEAANGGTDTLNFSAVSRDLLVTLGTLTVTDQQNRVDHGENNIENVVGGLGNDTFFFGNGSSITGDLDGGAGANNLIYSEYTTPVSVDLTSGSATGTHGIQRISNVIGGSANDTIIGDATSNTIDGGPGNDTIVGGGGSDIITYGNNPGTDTVVQPANVPGTLDFSNTTTPLTFVMRKDGGVTVKSGDTVVATGDNTTQKVIGGQGDDTFVFEKGARFAGTIDGGAGSNTLDYRAYTTPVTAKLSAGTATGTAGISRFDNVYGGSSVDMIIGNDNANRLYGGSGNDKLYGGLGNDTLSGGSGDDMIKGSDGDDSISGGSGNDKLYGDAGNDSLYGGSGNDSLVGGSGGDLLSGDSGNDVIVSKDSERDTVIGGAGRDRAQVDKKKDRWSTTESVLG